MEMITETVNLNRPIDFGSCVHLTIKLLEI